MARAKSRRCAAPLEPFTVDHFRAYARRLVLDSGDFWKLEDWQLHAIEDLFSGVQQVWLIVPQGNGKTTLVAGLALYHADFTSSPWVPVGARTSKQARIIYSLRLFTPRKEWAARVAAPLSAASAQRPPAVQS